MSVGVAVAGIATAALTGCGSNAEPVADETPAAAKSTPHPETFTAYGKIRMQNWAVKVTDGDGSCHMKGLRPKVVITDPDGKRVALADMGNRGDAPATSDNQYFQPGRCDVSWTADLVKQPGVFTASLDGYPDITASFTASDSDVTLRLGWDFRP